MELRNRSLVHEADELPLPPTNIAQIDQDTIRYISAGEKINDIETAIRELIENSIDAQAKYIEVVLAKFGVDSIVVDDNGLGIDEKNFDTLAQRYHTSKISNYSKLQESLETFGFRGEALNCLCKVSNVQISTKSVNSATGTKLTFTNALLPAKEPVARATGTTVTLKNLFYSMPVRRRELETTSKRQFDKVVKLIHEHLLARPHIKFSLCRKQSMQKKQDFIHGGTTLQDCIISIYSSKVFDSLMPIQQTGLTLFDTGDKTRGSKIEKGDKSINQGNNSDSADRKIAAEVVNIEHATESSRDFYNRRARKSTFSRERPNYIISGYISKIGYGRNSTDCQFIYVNKKPCDIPKVSRLVNEIYRNYSHNQYPFLCLFIQVQAWAADFNVPRKREVILQDEARLCSIIKDSLEEIFAPSAPGMKISCSSAYIPLQVKKAKLDIEPSAYRDVTPAKVVPEELVVNERAAWQVTPRKVPLQEVDPTVVAIRGSVSKEVHPQTVLSEEVAHEKVVLEEAAHEKVVLKEVTPEKVAPNKIAPEELTFEKVLLGRDDQPAKQATPAKETTPIVIDIEDSTQSENMAVVLRTDTPDFGAYRQIVSKDDETLKIEIENASDLSKALVRERYQRQASYDRKEYSYEIHPNFNAVAEQELRINLDRSSFKEMQVVGQFNKGFIISSLNEHLFVVDQHATDERANYEEELNNPPLTRQSLVHPRPLHFNTIQENAITNNVDLFRERGFEFLIDQSKEPGFRVMLAATSIWRGDGTPDMHLGKEDIVELIDVILESPNNLPTYTLKKIKNLAASRACRKSVMIGDPLSELKMTEIVTKMAELDNPWVCAHNRPTIRHLIEKEWFEIDED